jgi:hypothetical protein
MTNTANLELCEELFGLSGWGNSKNDYVPPHTIYPKGKIVPAYDLGYLLRKLPREYQNVNFYRKGELWGIINNYDTGGFKIYVDKGVRVVTIEAQTPEDCLAKLAIELFKNGILTKEGK